MDRPVTHLYADGGVVGKNPSPQAGTWAWCHTSGDYEAGWARTLGDWGYITPDLFGEGPVSNNVTELYAVLLGLEALPDGWGGTVCSDSGITIGRLKTWTDPPGVAWALRGVPAALQEMVWRQVGRLNWPQIEWKPLNGHPTRSQLQTGSGSRGLPVSIHNVWCDAHCKQAAERYVLDGHPKAEKVAYLESKPIAPDRPEEVVVAKAVRRSSQELSPMARLCRAERPRRVLGTIIGGSANPAFEPAPF